MVISTGFEPLLRWIPLLPLLSALLHAVWLVGRFRPLPRWLVVLFSCGTTLLSAVLAGWSFARLLQSSDAGDPLVDTVYTWFGAGIGTNAFSADIAFQLDSLSGVMLLLVSGLGVLVHVIAVEGNAVRAGEARDFQRFFAALDLLLAATLTFVLAENLLLMFVGWEGVALASAILVGFQSGEPAAARLPSFLLRVERLGRFAFVLALLLLFWSSSRAGLPSLSLHGLDAVLTKIAQETLPLPGGGGDRVIRLLDVIGLCVLGAAATRSAQFPFHVGLRHLVRAPSPASALMLSTSTLGGGVYLVCRLAPFFAWAPLASAALAWVGGLTALFAVAVALVQRDIKRLVAYVALSLVGSLFVAAGCIGPAAAIPQLINYGFGVALLMLAVGAIVAAIGGQTDVTQMGALEKRLPKLRAVTLVAVLTLSGLPGLAGFFGREVVGAALLDSALPGAPWLLGLGWLTSCGLALALFRLYFLVFQGESRVEREVRAHLREPPDSVLSSLYVLSVLGILGGYMALPQYWGDLFGIEGSNSLGNFVSPLMGASRPAMDVANHEGWVIVAITFAWVVGAVGGWGLFVRARARSEALAARFPRAEAFLRTGLGVETAYDRLLGRPFSRWARRFAHEGLDRGFLERLVIDGSARGVSSLASGALKFPQSGSVQGYGVVVVLSLLALLLYWVR